jgi:hypothetical protein
MMQYTVTSDPSQQKWEYSSSYKQAGVVLYSLLHPTRFDSGLGTGVGNEDGDAMGVRVVVQRKRKP